MAFKNNTTDHKGFSLVELLVVVTVIGIISVISIPYLQKAKTSAENTSILGSLKIMSQDQISFFAVNSRFAKLGELNTANNDKYGTTANNTILKGNYTFTMSPANPSNAELRSDYTIIASKSGNPGDLPYVISVSANGEIVQIVP